MGFNGDFRVTWEKVENTYLEIGRFSSATWLITREYMLQEVNYLRKRQVSVK